MAPVTGRQEKLQPYQETLEIDNPLATCGHCGFTTALSGTWSAEGGRLVFRADLNPLARRGPGMGSCGEGEHDGIPGALEFKSVMVDGRTLAEEEFTALKASARSPEAWDEEAASQ